MAKIVFTDCFVSVAGNDISDHVTSVTVNYSADTPEDTAFGDTAHVFAAGGLKNWSMDLEIQVDFAASQVDSIMFPLVGTEVAMIVRPTSSAVSATNPNYTGQGIVASYPPIVGSVGELGTSTCNVVAAGTLTRATS